MSTIVKAIECSMCGRVSPARDPLQGRCTECGQPHADLEELKEELKKDDTAELNETIRQQARQIRDLQKAVQDLEALERESSDVEPAPKRAQPKRAPSRE